MPDGNITIHLIKLGDSEVSNDDEGQMDQVEHAGKTPTHSDIAAPATMKVSCSALVKHCKYFSRLLYNYLRGWKCRSKISVWFRTYCH